MYRGEDGDDDLPVWGRACHDQAAAPPVDEEGDTPSVAGLERGEGDSV